MASKKTNKFGGLAVLAIFLFVAFLAIDDFGGIFSVTTYGGATQYYLADATRIADAVILTGSRNTAEILAPCTTNAEHRIRIVQTSNGGQNYNEIATQRHSIGAITYSTVYKKYLFSDGASATAFKFTFNPTLRGDYIAYESIQCNGADITNLQQLNFRVSDRPTSTPTIVKNCNLGANDKTRSCYYRTCEVQANGNWDYGAEKQSSSFCDYKPPVTPPTTPPVTPPACTPNWVTSEWSPCIDSKSTRSVTDNNNCANPSTSKPDVEKACTMPDVNPPANDGAGSQIDPVKYCTDRGFTGYDAPTNACTKTGTGSGTGDKEPTLEELKAYCESKGQTYSVVLKKCTGGDFLNQYGIYVAGGILAVFVGLALFLKKK